eukprot:1759484-Amphidinium_carterae.1
MMMMMMMMMVVAFREFAFAHHYSPCLQADHCRGRLLDGLLKQQDYIRLQQHHLQEMSRSLDNALHGSTEQPSPGCSVQLEL